MHVSRLFKKILAFWTKKCLPALHITLSRAEVLHRYSQNEASFPMISQQVQKRKLCTKKRNCSFLFFKFSLEEMRTEAEKEKEVKEDILRPGEPWAGRWLFSISKEGGRSGRGRKKKGKRRGGEEKKRAIFLGRIHCCYVYQNLTRSCFCFVGVFY